MPRILSSVPPIANETLSSWVQRLALSYHLDVDSLLQWIGIPSGGDQNVDLDVCPSEETIRLLSSATGVPVEGIYSLRALRPKSTLIKRHRGAFCPLCWDDDIEAGTTPYVRRSWIDAWCVHCTRHDHNLIWSAEATEAGSLPFMASIWKRDLRWSRATGLPFTGGFEQRDLDSHDFAKRIRNKLVVSRETKLFSEDAPANSELETRLWFRYLFELRNGTEQYFLGVKTPLRIASDLIAFCGLRFGNRNPLYHSAMNAPGGHGWTLFDMPVEARSLREPLGWLPVRQGSFLYSYYLWRLLVNPTTCHPVVTPVLELIPFCGFPSELKWAEDRVRLWPRQWRDRWQSLINDVIENRAENRRRRYRENSDLGR